MQAKIRGFFYLPFQRHKCLELLEEKNNLIFDDILEC